MLGCVVRPGLKLFGFMKRAGLQLEHRQLDARTAGFFCQELGEYYSRMQVTVGHEIVDGKSGGGPQDG